MYCFQNLTFFFCPLHVLHLWNAIVADYLLSKFILEIKLKGNYLMHVRLKTSCESLKLILASHAVKKASRFKFLTAC